MEIIEWIQTLPKNIKEETDNKQKLKPLPLTKGMLKWQQKYHTDFTTAIMHGKKLPTRAGVRAFYHGLITHSINFPHPPLPPCPICHKQNSFKSSHLFSKKCLIPNTNLLDIILSPNSSPTRTPSFVPAILLAWLIWKMAWQEVHAENAKQNNNIIKNKIINMAKKETERLLQPIPTTILSLTKYNP